MIRNSYFRAIHGMASSLKMQFFALIYQFSGIPRMVMEAFLRKNFGERHFSFSLALAIAFILMAIPVQYLDFGMGQRGNPGLDFLKHYLTWYIFVGVFIWQSWKHYQVIQKEKMDGFNYDKSSVYEGDVHPFFFGLRYKGRAVTAFEIECFIEPAVFLGAGLILAILGQSIGWLFIICSLIYGMSYRALYYAGDIMILDYIDQKLYNEYLEKAYMNNMHPSETHGVQFRGRHINNEVTRREMAPALVDNEKTYTAR